jgi:hypothetical protein
MSGTNRDTGRALSGWLHVQQSIFVILTTRYFERVMLRYFGCLLPHLLAQTVSQSAILRLVYSIVVAIDLFEPRFKVTQAVPGEFTRGGDFSLTLYGVYYPNATVGDFTNEQRQSIVVAARESGLVINPRDGT